MRSFGVRTVPQARKDANDLSDAKLDTRPVSEEEVSEQELEMASSADSADDNVSFSSVDESLSLCKSLTTDDIWNIMKRHKIHNDVILPLHKHQNNYEGFTAAAVKNANGLILLFKQHGQNLLHNLSATCASIVFYPALKVESEVLILAWTNLAILIHS